MYGTPVGTGVSSLFYVGSSFRILFLSKESKDGFQRKCFKGGVVTSGKYDLK